MHFFRMGEQKMIGMQAKRILNNQNGSVLILALILLVLLTIMGLSTINTSTVEVKIADNEQRHKMVLYAADAGIEAGRAALDTLKDADTGNWDNLFQGNQLVGQATGVSTLDAVIDAGNGRSVGPATFTLAVTDNNDLDGTTTVDTDNIAILTSTGTSGSTLTVVEAHVRYTGGKDEYAQEHYNAASTGQAAGASGTVTGSSRW
jgi:Tfp pilus assembly protein PilX